MKIVRLLINMFLLLSLFFPSNMSAGGNSGSPLLLSEEGKLQELPSSGDKLSSILEKNAHLIQGFESSEPASIQAATSARIAPMPVKIASWSSDPSQNTPVSTAAYNQWLPEIASDGLGGAIITWFDDRNGTYSDIYAQRLNSSGTPQWTANGLAVSTAAYSQSYPQIVSDGLGGAIITWEDLRSGSYSDIYAQRLNSSGIPQWTANGVAVSTAVYHQSRPAIASDGLGGAMITWYDLRNGSNYDIYAQRLNSFGTPQWTADGVAVSTAAYDQAGPQIASDGSGGAIITWYDFRNGLNHDIYAQKLNASGVPQWLPSNGVPVSITSYDKIAPRIVSDGAGGAIITWYDYRNGITNVDVYAQRLNSSGAPQWIPANGVAVSAAVNNQSGPEIVSDGAGGAIITWTDNRNGNNDIYAQRLGALSGSPLWVPNDGVAVSVDPNHQYPTKIVSDGAGGAIITWQDYRSGSTADIYAQRLNASGNAQWTANGVAVSTAVGNQESPQIIFNGSGCTIITWQDRRSGTNWDIYAQGINDQGAACVDTIPGTIFCIPTIDWTRQFGSSNYDVGYSVAVYGTAVYVAGYTNGALPGGGGSQGNYDAFLRKYDASGNIVWTRQFGTSSGDGAHSVAVDSSGNIYVGGYTGEALVPGGFLGINDAFLRKYDASGNVVWTRQFGTSDNDSAYSVALDSSGNNIYVAGFTGGALVPGGFLGINDAFLRKYDASGNVVWTRQFGTSTNDDVAISVAVYSTAVYVAGRTEGALPLGGGSQGGNDAFLIRYDAISGNVVWTRQFGTPGTTDDDVAYSVAVYSTAVYVAGVTYGALPGGGGSQGIADAFLRKYDDTGAVAWTSQFGSSGGEFAYSVALDGSGSNIYVTGMTYGALPGQVNKGLRDYYLRKYDTAGAVAWTGQFGSSLDDQAVSVAVDSSGNIYVAGLTDGALPGQVSQGSADAFLVKFTCTAAAILISNLTSWAGHAFAEEPFGKLHIAYVDANSLVYSYSMDGGNTWVTATWVSVNPSIGTLFGPAITVDKNGKVFILYGMEADPSNGLYYEFDLYVASNVTGSVSTTLLEGHLSYDVGHDPDGGTTNNGPRPVGIQLDSLNRVHAFGQHYGLSGFGGATFEWIRDPTSGLWGPRQTVVHIHTSNANDSTNYGGTLDIDPSNNITFFTRNLQAGNWYSVATPWGVPVVRDTTSLSSNQIDLIAYDTSGGLHAVYHSPTVPSTLVYRYNWNLPAEIALVAPTGYDIYQANLHVASQPKVVYNLFNTSTSQVGNQLYVTARQGPGVWSIPAIIASSPPANHLLLPLFAQNTNAGYAGAGQFVIYFESTSPSGKLFFKPLAPPPPGVADTTPPPTPNPISPASGSILNTATPAFTWTAVVDAPSSPPVYYDLRLATSASMASPLREKTNLATNTYTLTLAEALSPATYYWQVRARDSATPAWNYSAWSSPAWSFTVTPGGADTIFCPPTVAWTRQFGTTVYDEAISVSMDSSGNSYVAGHTYGALPGQINLGGADAFLRKYDATGSVVWTRQFGSSVKDVAFSVSVDSSGNIYVAGYTDGALPGQVNLGSADAFLIKYDAAGSVAWTRQFGSSNIDYAYSVSVDSSGNIYVAGSTAGALPGQVNQGTHDVFLRKYGASGNEIWTNQVGTSMVDWAYSVSVDSSGNSYVAGYTLGALPGGGGSLGGQDAFLIKYDTLGSAAWTRQFGSSNIDWAYSVSVDSSGSSYVAGWTRGALPGQVNLGGDDAFLRKYDATGSVAWTRQFGSSSGDYASSVSRDSLGNIYVAGQTYGALPGQVNLGNNDSFLVKYDTLGSAAWTRQFGTSGYDGASSVSVDSLGNIYVAGTTSGALPGQVYLGSDDAFLVKIVQSCAVDTTPPPTPNPIYPASGATISTATPTFTWTEVFDTPSSPPVLYDLQIASNSFMAPLFITRSNLATNTYTLLGAEALTNGTWYWRVRARDSATPAWNYSAWSSPAWSFNVPAVDTTPPPVPAQLSPANGAIVNTSTPAFSWNSVADSQSPPVLYDLRVATPGSMAVPFINKTNLANNNYTLSGAEALLPGAYWWQVRARDSAATPNYSPWSSPAWSFTVVQPTTEWSISLSGLATLFNPGVGDDTYPDRATAAVRAGALAGADPKDETQPPNPPQPPYFDIYFTIADNGEQYSVAAMPPASSITWSPLIVDLVSGSILDNSRPVTLSWTLDNVPFLYRLFLINNGVEGLTPATVTINMRNASSYSYTGSRSQDISFAIQALQNNPPGVTVANPNGGIAAGAIQVTAQASDPDSAPPSSDFVASVAFFYASSPYTSWYSIGTGALTSGASASGLWSASWNTLLVPEATGYKVRAIAYDSMGFSSQDDSDAAFSIVHKLTATATFLRGWNMFSLPLTLDPPDFNSQFGDDIATPFYVYNYNTPIRLYLQYIQGEGGKGFWIKVSSDSPYDIEGFPVPLADFEIALGRGWNQIGNPFLSSKSYGSLKVKLGAGVPVNMADAIASGWLSQSFYWYNPTTRLYDQGNASTGILETNIGYWVRTNVDNLTLIIPW